MTFWLGRGFSKCSICQELPSNEYVLNTLTMLHEDLTRGALERLRETLESPSLEACGGGGGTQGRASLRARKKVWTKRVTTPFIGPASCADRRMVECNGSMELSLDSLAALRVAEQCFLLSTSIAKKLNSPSVQRHLSPPRLDFVISPDIIASASLAIINLGRRCRSIVPIQPAATPCCANRSIGSTWRTKAFRCIKQPLEYTRKTLSVSPALCKCPHGEDRHLQQKIVIYNRENGIECSNESGIVGGTDG